MSTSFKIPIIEKARALIENEDRWCRGEFAKDIDEVSVCTIDSRAVKRCGLGALIAAAHRLTNDYDQACDIAISAMRPLHGSATLVAVNDQRGHAAVLALFDEVIAAR